MIAATPDHWHAPIYVAALRAGKHLYGEKPMTLTVDEGKILRRVVAASGRTFQVGNQQRSCQWFREAVAIAQSGLLGGKLTATCSIGGGKQGGPFEPATPPADLDWDLWLGQAPAVPYMAERYRSFRQWYDYAGGILTDWGAHHIDIAQWGIGGFDTGPVEIEGAGVIDRRKNCYNMPQTFRCVLTFANGNRIVVQDSGDNGILFEGERERLFVNRGRLSGNIVDQIAADPDWGQRIRDAASRLYRGPYGLTDGEFRRSLPWKDVCVAHMANFFACFRDGSTPISEVDSVQRSNTSCHLANIAIRLWSSSSNRLHDGMVRTYQEVFECLYLVEVRGAGNEILIALPRTRTITRAAMTQRARAISKAKHFPFDMGVEVEYGYRYLQDKDPQAEVLTDARQTRKAG